MPPIGAIRRGRSGRVNGYRWAIEKTRAWCCYTFGTKTNVIDFGFGGTRVAISLQDNWIFYTASEKTGRLFPQQKVWCAGSPGFLPELSLCADLLWSMEPPISSAAASTPAGPRSFVVKPGLQHILPQSELNRLRLRRTILTP
jgi:hypothetical protein